MEHSEAGHIRIGWGMRSLMPEGEVHLDGLYVERRTDTVRDPLMVTAVALEGEFRYRDGRTGSTQFVWAGCDLLGVDRSVVLGVRERIRHILPEIDPKHIILSATHTHNAPLIPRDLNTRPLRTVGESVDGVWSREAYGQLCIERIAEAIVEAWLARRPGGVSFGSGYAVLGHNRRVMDQAGRVSMFGRTNDETFRRIAGPEDHRIDWMLTWNEQGERTGLMCAFACPAQFITSFPGITADFVGELRQQCSEQWGVGMHVIGLIAPAGDQFPRDLIKQPTWPSYQEREKYMVDAASDLIAQINRRSGSDNRMDRIDWSPQLLHRTEEVRLPIRMVTAAEVEEASRQWTALESRFLGRQAELEGHIAGLPIDEKYACFDWLAVLERSRLQKNDAFLVIELHAVRIGETALVTNPFELFTEYGLRIKARSASTQTMAVQLACGYCGYLPTEESIIEGGYSTQVFSGRIGPEGGAALVEHSVQVIGELWTL